MLVTSEKRLVKRMRQWARIIVLVTLALGLFGWLEMEIELTERGGFKAIVFYMQDFLMGLAVIVALGGCIISCWRVLPAVSALRPPDAGGGDGSQVVVATAHAGGGRSRRGRLGELLRPRPPPRPLGAVTGGRIDPADSAARRSMSADCERRRALRKH